MAPHQSLDDGIDAYEPYHITSAADEAGGDPCSFVDILLKDDETSSREVKPTSILRRPTSHKQKPSHWPSNTVHFPSNIVTSIHLRPRTHVIDIPTLYYSPQDVKRFKREYRQLARVQSLSRERAERNNSQVDGNDNIGLQHPKQQLVPHDNSFWRSKVTRRWTYGSSSPSPSSSASSSSSQAAPRVSQPQESQFDPLNDGSGISSTYPDAEEHDDIDACLDDDDDDIIDNNPSSTSYGGGLFSSVFDVAKEAAVTILGSGPSYSSSFGGGSASSVSGGISGTGNGSVSNYRQGTSCVARQQCLVDTLYLF